MKTAKPIIKFDGISYKVRSSKVAIPDFSKMSRFETLKWLIANTYARGYSKPNPLAGMGAIIGVN